MIDTPVLAVVLAAVGAMLIGLGILIVVWPSVLLWLVATLVILAGIAMLLMASGLRGFGARRRMSKE